MTLRILTVCTGNICRSPFAARLLATKLDRTKYKTASAGTSAMGGAPMQETTRAIAKDYGVKGTETHRAQGLTAKAVAQADLILGMEREHRSEAAKLHPSAARRSFTLLEFAHIVSSIEDIQLQAMLARHSESPSAPIEAAMRLRGVVPRLSPDRLYDLQDPYGRSNQAYLRSAVQIEQALEQIVDYFYRVAQAKAALHNGHPPVVAKQRRK